MCPPRRGAPRGPNLPKPELSPESGGEEFPYRLHGERPAGPYVPGLALGAVATSPGKPWNRDGYVSVQVNVDAEGNNMLGDAANSPVLAMDPTNRMRLVIAGASLRLDMTGPLRIWRQDMLTATTVAAGGRFLESLSPA